MSFYTPTAHLRIITFNGQRILQQLWTSPMVDEQPEWRGVSVDQEERRTTETLPICATSYCLRTIDPGKDCIQLDIPDHTPIWFCSLKHLAVWADWQKQEGFRELISKWVEPGGAR